MKKTCKFYREENGEWYIDLPEWLGNKSDLQMVLNADTLLEIIGSGNDTVIVKFSDEHFENAKILNKVCDGILSETEYEVGGATYNVQIYDGVVKNFDLWLCEVTRFVFGDMPEIIYFAEENS